LWLRRVWLQSLTAIKTYEKRESALRKPTGKEKRS
jgi:hypothetical protein